MRQPQLQVRRARIEDNDDLLLLLAAAAAAANNDNGCAQLAALPASCQPGEPFALARLIGSQDSCNAVLVALEGERLVRCCLPQLLPA